METKIIEELKAKLEAEKANITKELEAFAKEDKATPHNWQAQYPSKERGNKEEEADEAGEFENMRSIEENLEMRLKDVGEALEKIAKGSYGACEKCNKEIEVERLQAAPEAKHCIACNK